MGDEENPFPNNEFERIVRLSDLDLEFSELESFFKDLTILATKVTGTQISLINIIDSYTQWTVASQGIDVKQTRREQSICQHTILSNRPLEVKDLRLDERFNAEDYVDGPGGFRYYIGIPLQIEAGINIGTLCVLDTEVNALSPEKIELLEIIAHTVVERLKSMQLIQSLRSKLHESEISKKRAAHDIRGPLAGIIGLSDLIKEQGSTADIDEVLEYISMINKSGRSLLDLTDEILSQEHKKSAEEDELSLSSFKEKIFKLYQPQAKSKNIDFSVNIEPGNQLVPFKKNKLLQIVGNLISNAMKFTPENGKVLVTLGLVLTLEEKLLEVSVSDNGHGIEDEAIQQISLGRAHSTPGTMGEKGYGFGLSLVKQLVDSLKGTMTISSTPEKGTCFKIVLPQKI
jgi:signal transduction histidine kinase